MKIAIPSMDDSGMGAAVSEHFGQTPYFTLVDSETGTVTVQRNPGHEGGRTPAQVIAEAGADVVLGGGMGGRAIQLLGGLGIDVYLGADGTVEEALTAHREGKLPSASEAGPCRDDCPEPRG